MSNLASNNQTRNANQVRAAVEQYLEGVSLSGGSAQLHFSTAKAYAEAAVKSAQLAPERVIAEKLIETIDTFLLVEYGGKNG